MKNPNISANDFYDSFMGTESYYSYIGKLLLTDGVITIAREESCFWFLDCIASYQYSEKFQKKNSKSGKSKELKRIDSTFLRLTEMIMFWLHKILSFLISSLMSLQSGKKIMFYSYQ